MSVYTIYMKDGAKMMRPVLNREEYMALRNGGEQRSIVAAVRAGDDSRKSRLVQMNYSCLPNEDDSLKGSKRMSTTVGMDIDHIPPQEMTAVRDRILSKKDDLGLRMLEMSARGKGYHLAFQRRPELSQEENLRWASDLLGVEFDKGAKDITRVFFTTTGEDLLYLDDSIFEIVESTQRGRFSLCTSDDADGKSTQKEPSPLCTSDFPTAYHGIPFEKILKKYWELNNSGFEPTEGDRDTLTFQLASDLRHICGKSFEWLDQVIPCYDGFPLEEKRAKIRNALASKYEGMPTRLKAVLDALSTQRGRFFDRGRSDFVERSLCTAPEMPVKVP